MAFPSTFFLLGLAESNKYLAYNFFCLSGQEKMKKRDLGCIIAQEHIFNHLLEQKEKDKDEERRRLLPRTVEYIGCLSKGFFRTRIEPF